MRMEEERGTGMIDKDSNITYTSFGEINAGMNLKGLCCRCRTAG